MPSMQILDRQVDPTAQLALQTSQSIADSIQKKQAMQLALMQLKQQMKQTDSEIEQHKIQRTIDFGKFLLDAQPIVGNTPEGKAALLKAAAAAHGPDTWETAARLGQVYQPIFDAIGQAPSPSENIARNMAALQTGGQSQNQPDNNQQSSTIDATNDLRAGAIGGNSMIMGGMSIDPAKGTMNVNMINPQAEAIKAKAATSGTELAKKDIARQQFSRDFEDFKLLNDQVQNLRSEGGILDRIKKAGSIGMAGLSQDTPEGQLIAAYDAVGKRMATTLARQVDVGNLSQTEQEAAAKMIPSKFDSKGTATIKMAFIDDMNRVIGGGAPSQVKSLIAKYQEALKGTQNPNSPKNKAINSITSTQSNNNGYIKHSSGLEYKLIP